MKLYRIPYSKNYEDEVIDHIAKHKRNIQFHSHALEEVGMCLECDSAALLEE